MKQKVTALLGAALITLFFGSIAQANILRFTAILSGANEVPPVTTTGFGEAELLFDTSNGTYTLFVRITGLSTTLTGSHIHEASAGSNGPVIHDLGALLAAPNRVYSGKRTGTYGGSVDALLAGRAYVNVHSVAFPNGELRGQLSLVPETREHVLNVSSRGLIDPGNGQAGTLFTGFVLASDRTILVRALGDSLRPLGVSNALPDAAVELFDSAGVRIAANDNWASTQPLAIRATGLAPSVATDAAITRTLPAGTYTAQVDASKGAGVAVLEVYSLPTPTLIGALQAAGQFTTLIAAVQAAGLVDVLSGPGPFTLFAPTDAAFAKLPAGTLDSLLEPANRTSLLLVVAYHLVPAKVLSASLEDGTSVLSLSAETLTISLTGGARVNTAVIQEVDFVVTNGVIHPIDTVLLPPSR